MWEHMLFHPDFYILHLGSEFDLDSEMTAEKAGFL